MDFVLVPSDKIKNLKALEKILFWFVWLPSTFLITFAVVDATEAPKLTDVFFTKSFAGSFELINKAQWIGTIMSTLITVFCGMGLFMFAVQKLISITYLGGKSFWDSVDEYQQEFVGTKFAGFEGMLKSFKEGKKGTSGTNIVIGFLYSILPNVRYLSEYNRDRMPANLSEEDTILTYLLKTFMESIIMVTVLSIGFSGTLFKGYSVLVDGITTAADRLVETDLTAMVNRMAKTGQGYNFVLGANGSGDGKIARDISVQIYAKVLTMMNVLTSEDRMYTGRKIEEYMSDKMVESGATPTSFPKLESLLKKSSSTVTDQTQLSLKTQEDLSLLKYTIVYNTASTYQGGSLDIPLKNFVSTDFQASGVGSTMYAHVVLSKDLPRLGDYFKVSRPATSQ